MNAMMMSALAAVGLFGFLGTPAFAQSDAQAKDGCCVKRSDDCCTTKPDNCCIKKMEGCCERMKDECCTWSTVLEGKRTVRKDRCVQDQKSASPSTVRIEVKPEDRQAGDDWGFRTVGKRTEKVAFRDIERKPETTAKAECTSQDGCKDLFVTVGKHTERRSFCDHHGERRMCGEKAGDCSICRK